MQKNVVYLQNKWNLIFKFLKLELNFIFYGFLIYSYDFSKLFDPFTFYF